MSTASGPAPRQSPQRPEPARPSRAPLRVVAPRPAPMPRTPFVVALVVLLGAGLVGLLLLNTAMQRRAFSLTSLDQRADSLDVRAAALTMRTDRLASTQRLAQQAAELGMVPNTNPVFLRLSDGQVVGDPVPATTASSVPGLLPAPPTVTEPPRRAAGDTRPGDTRPGDTRPGDTRPADSRPGDAQAGSGDDAPTGGRKPQERTDRSEDGPRTHDRAGSQGDQ